MGLDAAGASHHAWVGTVPAKTQALWIIANPLPGKRCLSVEPEFIK